MRNLLLPSRRSPARAGDQGRDEPETRTRPAKLPKLAGRPEIARLPASPGEPEQKVLERLACVTAELNDPWAAARALFAAPPPDRGRHTE
jgi:hypothetical protein